MWASRADQIKSIENALMEHSQSVRELPGVIMADARSTLALQIVASKRRIDYTNILRRRVMHPDRANPNSNSFDAEMAAIYWIQNNNLEEAIWLVFLNAHFGKPYRYGWRRLQDVYSGLGTRTWDWKTVSGNLDAFLSWLRLNADKIDGAFGNHRKYETLDPNSKAWTGNVIRSYLNWIGEGNSQVTKFRNLVRAAGNQPESIFDAFYQDMDVLRFGRLGKFDFLALLGRLDLVPASPGSAYLKGATGPLTGTRLLFGMSETTSPSTLDDYLIELDGSLDVGMQVLEDSICNWQKSPDKFVQFKG